MNKVTRFFVILGVFLGIFIPTSLFFYYMYYSPETSITEYYVPVGILLLVFGSITLIAWIDERRTEKLRKEVWERFPQCSGCVYADEKYPRFSRGCRLYSHCDDCSRNYLEDCYSTKEEYEGF